MHSPAAQILRVCAILLFAASLHAQSKTHVAIPAVAGKPEDVSSPEAIVNADYDSISGAVGVARQWARDLSLYAPEARNYSPRKSKTGEIVIWSGTEQEFADETDAMFVKEGFTEHELAHKIQRFGAVATVFSSYEAKLASNGKLVSRGVNVYQLAFDGKRWWIVSIAWDGAKEIGDIPAELMPKK